MLMTIIAFIFVLGVLVFIHEFGHFIVAKIVGIRVERFSLGFPPRMIGKKIGETDYCLSWVPIGGYVKMSGMIDESMDEDSIKGEPWEFMSKPYYQRFLVIFAGPLMNILLAVAIFAVIYFHQGMPEPVGPVVGEVTEESYATSVGLQKGDLIKTVDNKAVNTWYDVDNTAKDKDNVRVAWLRGDSLMSAQMNVSLIEKEFRTWPAFVGMVNPKAPADSIGLKVGDRIIAINDTPILTWTDLTTTVHAKPEETISIQWERDGEIQQAQVTTMKDPTTGYGLIGIAYQSEDRKLGSGEAIVSGFNYSITITKMVYDSIKKMFRGEESFKNALGGPIIIAKMAGESARAGTAYFLTFMAFLSLNLGFLNLLPVPVLDGGHLLILTIEAVIRRPISTKAKMVIQQVGMALLLMLMVFVVFNDIQRIWRDKKTDDSAKVEAAQSVDHDSK